MSALTLADDGHPPDLLFLDPRRRVAPPDATDQPAFFRDLNLDQVVAGATAGRDEHQIAGWYGVALSTADEVVYRQDVFRDLQQPSVHAAVGAFAVGMQRVRQELSYARRTKERLQSQRWQLDAVLTYSSVLRTFVAELSSAEPQGAGLVTALDALRRQVAEPGFVTRETQAAAILEQLRGLRFNVHLRGPRVSVAAYDGEADRNEIIASTFARFRRADRTEPGRPRPSGGSHLEQQVARLVAQLFPAPFAALEEFAQRHVDVVDPVVERLDHDLQFYLGYLDYVAPLSEARLDLCFPQVSTQSKQERVVAAYDLPLAVALASTGRRVVVNDYGLHGAERTLVVSGPNNGGKTTFARMFGQLHHLARLGCPVPGSSARLMLCDGVYTHFEREEQLASLAGKLQEELQRLKSDLQQATDRSVVVMNEMFSSTTVADALLLSRRVLERLAAIDCLGVCVTFLDELSVLNAGTVSMVAAVDPQDPATRTLEVHRRKADGRAYAMALASKYGLTAEALTERLSQ